MKILVSKINHLGDAVSFLPTLKGISNCIPNAELTVVCTKIGKQVFEGATPKVQFFIVNFNEIRSYMSIWAVVRSFIQLKNHHFSCSFHSYDEPSFAYLLSAALRIPTRVGFATNIAKGQKFLSDNIPWDPSRNIVDINYDLVRFLANKWDLHPTRTPIYYTPQDSQVVQQHLKGVGVLASKQFIVIHPGAKLVYREWGNEKFAKLAALIEKELGWPVVFIGEKSIGQFHRVKEIFNISIKQLACLLEMSSLFIGNNSGPLHIATAMGTPSVSIQGPTADNWDVFWSEVQYRKIRASIPACIPCEKVGSIPGSCTNVEYTNGCMKEISIQQVLSEVASLLNHKHLS